MDQLGMKYVKTGWTKDKKIPYRASIEVNNRLLAKLTTPGIAVVTGSGKDGYQTQVFTDIAVGEAFIKSLPANSDRLAVGLQIPPELVGRLFSEIAGTLTPKTPVGFVAVSGPSFGPIPKVLAGVDDLNLEVLWKTSAKD